MVPASYTPPVTICVLAYGDYLPLIRTTIESIVANCERSRYRLVVGGNAVGAETRGFLEQLAAQGVIDRLYLSGVNINKCPMMRRLFAEIDTEFIWWFDDDSHIVGQDAFRARLDLARGDHPDVAIWGHQFFFGHERDFSYGTDVIGFVKGAPWYRGKEPPSWAPGGKGEFNFEGRGVGDGRWFFVTGGCWFVRTAAIRALDWPDPRLIKRNDDVFLSEALRQGEWKMRDIGPLGVAINSYPRRGEGEDRETMRKQLETAPLEPGCLFIPTFRDSDLLAQNFSGRPDLTAGLDVYVFDDNFEIQESARVEEVCRGNSWHYRRSNRPRHDGWEAEQADLSGFNRFVWESMTSLGEQYEYVIKIDTDAFVIEAGWHDEMARLLSGQTGIAGTPEYRSADDVMSFWRLAAEAGYRFQLPAHVLHAQGGIYGLSREALRKLREMGFLHGKHTFFAEDCYMSYACWLLDIPFFATTTVGSWHRPYRPGLKAIRHLMAIHPLTRLEWNEFLTSEAAVAPA